MLALSVGKLINPELGYIKCETHNLAGDYLGEYNRRFLIEYDKYFQNHKDKRTLGILIQLDTPAHILDKNIISVCHEIALINRVPENTDEHRKFVNICNRVFM